MLKSELQNEKLIHVLVDEKELADSIVKNEYVVLMFHANWSVDSRKFQRQFEQIRERLYGQSLGFYEVSFKTLSIVEKFNIKTFPSFVIITTDGIVINYKGELNAAKVLDWIQLNTNNRIEVIENPSQLDNNLRSVDNILVVPILNQTDIIYSEDGKSFLNRTDQILSLKSVFRHTPIKLIDNKLLELLFKGLKLENSLLNEVEYPNHPFIALIKNYDERINFISVASYKELLHNYLDKQILNSIFPFVNRLSLNYYIEVVNKQRNYVILLLSKGVYSTINEAYQEALSKYIPNLNEKENDIDNHKDAKYPLLYLTNREFYYSAHKMREFVFLKGEAIDTTQTTLLLDYNLKEDDFPVILTYEFRINESPVRHLIRKDILLDENFESSMKKAGKCCDYEAQFERYSDLENSSAEFKQDLIISRNIRGVLKQLKQGTLKQFLKSETKNENFEAKKESLLSKNIYLLAGSDYQEFFQDKDKSYLIFHTKRNNGMCREVEKEFIKLASFLIKEKQLMFGIIDVSVNDLGNDIRSDMSIILFSYKLDQTTSNIGNENGLRYVIYEHPDYSKDALIDFLKQNT